MILYKLTDKNARTRNNTQWGENITHELPPCGDPITCSENVLHAYTSPALAVLLNHIHANIKDPILWECEGKICVENWDKVGCFKLTTLRQITLPKVDVVKFSILCASTVLPNFERIFPQDDRPGKAIDCARSARSARSAAQSARSARSARSAAQSAQSARSAAWSAAESARSAARSATWSAESARFAAWSAAESAAWSAAESAAQSARFAARSAARSAGQSIDFKKLAEECII